MEEFALLFIVAGILMEVLGILYAFRGKSLGLELIVLGILSLLVGFLA